MHNSSKQQQQTNAEQVDPVRQQVNRPEQTSAVINEQASGINHTSTPATSHQLTGEANSVEREMVSGESCSGRNQLNHLQQSTVELKKATTTSLYEHHRPDAVRMVQMSLLTLVKRSWSTNPDAVRVSVSKHMSTRK